MKKSLRMLCAIALVFGIHSAWAEDSKAVDTSGMGQGNMQGHQMMDKEHMQQMHEHMEDMHKSNGNGALSCDKKSNGKCESMEMKKEKTGADKSKASTKTEDTEHSEHH